MTTRNGEGKKSKYPVLGSTIHWMSGERREMVDEREDKREEKSS